MNVIGEVATKTCVLIDDMVDTAGTLCQAASVLKQRGAERVVAYITHPVLSGPAVQRIQNSSLDEIVVTDTIPLERCRQGLPPDPAAQRGRAAGRNPAQDQRSGVRELAVPRLGRFAIMRGFLEVPSP